MQPKNKKYLKFLRKNRAQIEPNKNRRKIWFFSKKGIDKGGMMWYTNKARRKGALQRVIENWTTTKNSLILWKVQKVSKEARSWLSEQGLSEASFFMGALRLNTKFREFDPGSGWTLAACITHSSRTNFCPQGRELVADGWVTREQPAYARGTTVGNDC